MEDNRDREDREHPQERWRDDDQRENLNRLIMGMGEMREFASFFILNLLFRMSIKRLENLEHSSSSLFEVVLLPIVLIIIAVGFAYHHPIQNFGHFARHHRNQNADPGEGERGNPQLGQPRNG